MPKIYYYNIRALGLGLRSERRKKKLEPEKVSKDLGIPLKYLEAMEEGRFFDLPSEKLAKKYLRFYCRYLNLDHQAYWREVKRFNLFKPLLPGIRGWDFWHWHEIGRKIAIGLAVLGVLIFFTISIERIFSAPKLEIINPKTLDFKTQEPSLEISGRSEKEAEIVINNQNFFIDSKGIFKATIDLQSGLNFIKITAKKKYSRTNEVLIRVLLEE